MPLFTETGPSRTEVLNHNAGRRGSCSRKRISTTEQSRRHLPFHLESNLRLSKVHYLVRNLPQYKKP